MNAYAKDDHVLKKTVGEVCGAWKHYEVTLAQVPTCREEICS